MADELKRTTGEYLVNTKEAHDKYMAIISCLTIDYDSIIFIDNSSDDPACDTSEIIRDNEEITKYIPGWKDEESFTKRLALIEEHICHPEDRESFHAQSKKDVVINQLKKHSFYSIRFRIVLNDQIHHYKMKFSTTSWKQDATQGIVVGWSSIDDIVKQEQDRIHAIEEARLAQESSRMKSLLVQNISHDIRTPLNAIVGFSQLLSMPSMYLGDEDRAQFAEYISTSAEMLTALIDDVLNLSDIEHNMLKINMANASCNEILRKSVNCCRTRVVNGVNLYYTSELEPSYTIHTDAKRVQQIMINLLSNACKHTDVGEIHVHCSKNETPGYITFSVTDTGCGIPADKAEEIFERFKSLDYDKGGHGMGLNICRTLSDMLGGKVTLDTSYTGGARFVLLLPDRREEKKD